MVTGLVRESNLDILGFRKLLRLLSGTNETILDVLLGRSNLRKLGVAVCSWGWGAEGSTVETY